MSTGQRPGQSQRLVLRGQNFDKVQKGVDANPSATALDASGCQLNVCVLSQPPQLSLSLSLSLSPQLVVMG